MMKSLDFRGAWLTALLTRAALLTVTMILDLLLAAGAALAVLALTLVVAPAAMAQPASVEGESFTHPRGTAVVYDQMYSGGAALQFKKSKVVATKQVTISEPSTVLVRARADQKKGGSPTLTIRVDGENSGMRRITSTALADYNYPAVTLQPGTHTIGLKGGNIAQGRNVFVDVLTFPTGGPPPPPPGPPAGTLDASFGTDGKVVTSFSAGTDQIADIARQDDGKIVAVGRVDDEPYTASKLAISRYNTDGSLDTTFGTGGLVTDGAPTGSKFGDNILVQPDGKLVVGGTTINNNGGHPYIARYNADGSLDTTFASMPGDYLQGMALADGGKIVAVTQNGNLSRFNADGSLDTTFGTDGTRFIQDFAQYQFDLAVQPDGRILTTGGYTDGTGALVVSVHRFTAVGQIDNTFSQDGVQTIHPGTGGLGRAITLQEDGKVLVTGEVNTASGGAVGMYRLNADGSMDSSFGNNGMAIIGLGNTSATDVAYQSDGKIVVSGYVQKDPSVNKIGFLALRLNADGSLDSSFGSEGKVIVEVDPNRDSAAQGLLLQPDGKLVLGGNVGFNPDDSALVRLHG